MIQFDEVQIEQLFGVKLKETALWGVAEKLELNSYLSEGRIMGGAIVRTLMKKDIGGGDVDVFFKTEEAFNNTNKKIQKLLGLVAFDSKYAVTFEMPLGSRKQKIQLIKARFMDTEVHMDSFDFHHCKLALIAGIIYADPLAIPYLTGRKIGLGEISNPLYSLHRLIKYKKMGFTDCDDALGALATKIGAYDGDSAYGSTPKSVPMVFGTVTGTTAGVPV